MIEPSPHLEPSDVAAYAEGQLPEAERERVERHLSRCATCRDELTVAIRARGRGRPRGARWIPAVAAAAVVAVLIGRGLFVDGGGPVLRDGGRDNTFAIVEPPEGASRPVAAVRMTWRAADDATYRVTITSEAGDIVWSTSTGDTTLVVPNNVGLTGGERYFWFVDALFSDGTSATTGASSFATVQEGSR